MATADKVFAGGIPAIYEEYMVPMIFEPYALDVSERIASYDPGNVLEIAAGTGVLTRALARKLGPDAKIVASDLNQPMLDMAKARHGEDARIAWQQADGLALPFEDQMFDAVVCQFGVMFFPDKVQGYREARRVLKSGANYVFNVWDRVETNDFIHVACQTLADIFPDDPPRFMYRTPHGYCDLEVIGEELRAAGFEAVAFETVDRTSEAVSALAAATGYCQGNPLRNEIEARAPGQLQEVTLRVAEALEKRFGNGPIRGNIRAHIATATR
jgi:ubiquinone/menaquinone biosynthesis C-methylase UbiE